MTVTSCIETTNELITDDYQHTGIDVSVGYQVETRALSDAVTSIDWLLLDGDGAVVSDGSQTKSASNFGTISIDAAVGEYKLVLLATKMANYSLSEEGIVTASKVSDTFAKTFDVTIGRNERGSLNAELPRVASKLVVKSADNITSDITKFDADIEGIALTYDIVAGEGGEATTRHIEKSAISAITTDGKLSLSVFAFVPEGSSTDAAKITINLYNSSDEKVKTLTYENIPMEVNKTTTLTAAMFHAVGSDATVSVDAEWGEGIDIER